jgi:hypothetical protein
MGRFTLKPSGATQIESTQIRWFSLGIVRNGVGWTTQAVAQGNSRVAIRFESTQIRCFS